MTTANTSTPTLPPVPVLDINRVLHTDTNGKPPLHIRQMQKVMWAFLHHMSARGWSAVSINDGDGHSRVRSPKHAMEQAFNLDECWLTFRNKDDQRHAVYIVFCNAPEEIVSDWSFTDGDPDGFNAALDSFNAEDHLC